jgi:hypothetical protein
MERSFFRNSRHRVGPDSPCRPNGQKRVAGVAKGAGDRLLAQSQESAKCIYWTISTAASKEYPNFSLGTAGIGYFLSELYEASKDERYLLSALAASHYLRSIVSKAESSRYLIFHDDAGGRDLFYVGWCHGPAGNRSVFLSIVSTEQRSWLAYFGREPGDDLNGLRDIPERQTPGYWNNISRCC